MSVEIPTTPKRVKVYQLSQEVWIDHGTGFCNCNIIDNQPFIVVTNEVDNDKVILKTPVAGDTQYQKQQDTLVVWTEPDSRDMALSFQEAEGCSNVCEFLVYVQQHFCPNISVVALISSETEGDITEVIAGPGVFPPEPDLDNLDIVLDILSQTALSQYTRESSIRFLIGTNYIQLLVALFSKAEDLHLISALHYLNRITKTLSMIIIFMHFYFLNFILLT